MVVWKDQSDYPAHTTNTLRLILASPYCFTGEAFVVTSITVQCVAPSITVQSVGTLASAQSVGTLASAQRVLT